MRVVIVSSHFPPAWDWGGSPRSMWNLSRAVAGRGIEVTVLTTNATQTGIVDVDRDRIEQGVRIISSPVLGSGHSVRANRHGFSPALWREIAKQAGAADLMHINEFWGPTPAIAALASVRSRTPYIVSMRGQLECRSLSEKSWKKRIALGSGVRRLLQHASALHYATEMERALSPSWAGLLPSIVVPNPVEVARREGDGSLRRDLGVAEKTVLLGVFGRIHPRKGLDLLVPALSMAVRQADLKLLIVGLDEGAYQAEIERAIEEHGIAGRVIFTGALAGRELTRAYAAVDMLVLSSHGESFGNVVVEAAAQGTPCMISDQVGVKDWVVEQQIGEVLPLDVARWATALSQLSRRALQDRWRPEPLRAAAERSFSLQAVAEKMCFEYRKIVESREGRRAVRANK